MLSTFLVPYSLYLSLEYWVYPLKEYVGDTGCYVLVYGRDIGNFITTVHSFFMAVFRYTCLFHGNFLKKSKLSPKVSKFIMWIHSRGPEQSMNQSYSNIFVMFLLYSVFSGICKVHGNTKFLGANILMGIVL